MLWHWILTHIGVDYHQSIVAEWNAFWSGFGSDLGYFGIVAVGLRTLKHQNCHVKRCWRLGSPVDGTAYKACHKHHPAHGYSSRNVSAEAIATAHSRRRR